MHGAGRLGAASRQGINLRAHYGGRVLAMSIDFVRVSLKLGSFGQRPSIFCRPNCAIVNRARAVLSVEQYLPPNRVERLPGFGVIEGQLAECKTSFPSRRSLGTYQSGFWFNHCE